MGRKRGLSDEAKWGYLLVAPTIIGLIVLNVYPFIQTLILSFSTTHPFGFYEISGIGNYVKMFSSQEFWKATLELCLFLYFNGAGRDFSGSGNSSAAECEDCRKDCLPRHLFSADGSCAGSSGYGLEMDF